MEIEKKHRNGKTSVNIDNTTTASSVNFLFRDECLNRRHLNMSGRTAQHRRSIVGKQTISVSILMILAILAFWYFGSYTRKVTIKGVLAPQLGTSHLTATTSAIVDEIYVREGDFVGAGQRILKLSKESTTSRGPTFGLTAERIEEQIRLVKARKNLTKLKHDQDVLDLTNIAKQLNKKKEILEEEISFQRQLVESKRSVVKKYHLLVTDGAVSMVAYEDVRKDFLLAAVELQKTKQTLQNIIADIENMPLKKQAIGTTTAIADSAMNNELLMLSRELLNNANSQAVFIVSSIAGTITAINTSVGQAVLSGATLATTYPAGSKLQANLYTPSEGRGFIETLQHAHVRVSAFPFQKFGMVKGKILSVSDTPYQASEMPVQLAEIVDPNRNYYKTVVELDDEIITANGRQRVLKPGLIVEADLVLETRKMYEWLLAPLYSFTKKHI